MKLILALLLSCLTVSAAQSVTLAWNANSETNLLGYRLYVGNSSGVYLNSYKVDVPTTQFTVTNLSPATTYFFAVTAFTDELESEKSNEVSWRSAPVPPAKPGGLRISTSLQALNQESNRWTNVWTLNTQIENGSALYRRLVLTASEPPVVPTQIP